MDETAEPRNLFLESELASVLRNGSFTRLEKIPEVRALMAQLLVEKGEKSRLAESLNHLPLSDIQKLFEDYIEARFDAHLYTFFDKLYHGVERTVRKSLHARLKAIEDSITDLKRSVLMCSLQPNAFIKAEMVCAIHAYLSSQPGRRTTLDRISKHLIYDKMFPVPGGDRTEKYKFVLGILRHDDCIREIEGFLYELTRQEDQEECDGLASARERQALSQQISSVCPVDGRKGKGSR